MIIGGTRDAPEWSQLESYYLPYQQMNDPSGLSTNPFSSAYRPPPIQQMMQLPELPSFTPSNPVNTAGGGSTAYDEIMSRLGRRTPTPTPPPQEEVEEASSGEIPDTGRFTGIDLPEGWQNGDPGHGAARAHVMMLPDQIEARRAQEAQEMAAAALSELGYGGFGTGQPVGPLSNGGTGGSSGSQSHLGPVAGGSYYGNTAPSIPSADFGQPAPSNNDGWRMPGVEDSPNGLDWEAIGFWLRVAAGDPIATYDALTGNIPGADRRRRNNNDREASSDRERVTEE